MENVHLLFEQSGTFRDEFRALGYNAQDYDIQNEYGKTDVICDLFCAIRELYEGHESVLDRIEESELVFAFFPCTQFESQKTMIFSGVHCGMRNWSDMRKIEYCMRMHKELHEYYELFSMLVVLAIRRGWRLVIENPYSSDHYLTRYFPIKPRLIDKNRLKEGDYFKKPTQFWVIGFEPKSNFVLEPLTVVRQRQVTRLKPNSKERSEMHPQYARRFIKQFIL